MSDGSYCFMVVGLEHCPHSENAVHTLKERNLKCKVKWINRQDKEKCKQDLRIQTFPQVYLQLGPKTRDKKYHLGGNDKLQQFIQLLEQQCSNNQACWKQQMDKL